MSNRWPTVTNYIFCLTALLSCRKASAPPPDNDTLCISPGHPASPSEIASPIESETVLWNLRCIYIQMNAVSSIAERNVISNFRFSEATISWGLDSRSMACIRSEHWRLAMQLNGMPSSVPCNLWSLNSELFFYTSLNVLTCYCVCTRQHEYNFYKSILDCFVCIGQRIH